MSRTKLVIPCFNEAGRLPMDAFCKYLREPANTDLVMVNDGSSDHTLELLERLRDYSPGRVQLLNLPKNVGKAEAVRLGVMLAMERSPQFVGFLDADLATPLEEVRQFIDVLERRHDIDVVIGSRLPILGRRINRRKKRYLLGRAFATAASRVLGLRIADTQCGAKLFRANAPLQLVFSAPFLSRWIFDVEIFARLILVDRDPKESLASHTRSTSLRFFELPLEQWEEVSGSRLRGQDFRRAAFELLQIYWNYFVRGWEPEQRFLLLPGELEKTNRAA